MLIEPIDPPSLPETSARYTHGIQVTGAQKLVFVSGQPPCSWAVTVQPSR